MCALNKNIGISRLFWNIKNIKKSDIHHKMVFMFFSKSPKPFEDAIVKK